MNSVEINLVLARNCPGVAYVDALDQPLWVNLVEYDRNGLEVQQAFDPAFDVRALEMSYRFLNPTLAKRYVDYFTSAGDMLDRSTLDRARIMAEIVHNASC